ncbi:MAG: gliding motility-associated C-terminal domain-containing protein, partial [Bacteroidales bacterium]|nr:gliding motility-associated C-terminal domain-containing protein [Bacteroidales bacterium]
MMKQYNNIGDLYRKKFSDYTPEPPAEVWNNIQSKMKGKKSLRKTTGLSVVGLAVAGVVAYLLFAHVQQEKSASLSTENIREIITDKSPHSNDMALPPDQPATQPDLSDTFLPVQKESNTQTPKGNHQTDQEQESTLADNHSPAKEAYHSSEVNNNTTKQTDETVAQTPTSVVVPPANTAKPCKAVIISKDTSICKDAEAQLLIYHAKNIRWSTGETKNKIIVNPSFDEIYSVSFTMENGKDSMAFIHVKVVECTEMYIPNAFTPNGDGMNDVFLAKSNLD